MKRNPQVPKFDGIDLDFTPGGYFAVRDLKLLIPSDIKGKARRELARTLAKQGEALPPDLAAPELSEEDRRMWGRIHPMMMGGEYLPAMCEDEVEIVRISLASTTGDQISVRARRVGDRIAYSIVDEYDSGDQYDLHPKTSRLPLSLRQLVAMLDGACVRGGAVMSPVVWQVEDGLGDVESMRHFVSVESDFYPGLGDYYEARFDAYFAEHSPQAEEGG